MKVTFSDQEIEQLIQILQDKADDTYREEEEVIVPKLIRKLKTAQHYSMASTSKSKYLLFARMDRERVVHEAAIAGILKAKADLDQEMKEHFGKPTPH